MTQILFALLPNGRQQFFNANGVPLAGGSVFMYAPGTTNPQATYEDPYGTTLNQNPVPLDVGGTALIYGSGQYRQVVEDANGVIIWDALTYGSPPSGIAGSGFGVQTPIASAATTDLGTVPSHNVLITGSTIIGAFGASANAAAPLYYVEFDGNVEVLESSEILIPGGQNWTFATGDSALVEYEGGGNWKIIAIWPVAGLNQGFGPQKGLASAATTDLGTISSNNVNITGVAGINSFGASASLERPIFSIVFAGALTLTNSAALALPGAANIITGAGDSALVEYLGGGNWNMLEYNRQAGLPVPPAIRRVYTTTVNGAFNFVLPTTVTPQTRIRFRLCAPGGGGGGIDAANTGGGGGGGSGGCWDGVLYGFAGGMAISGTVGSPGGAGGVGAAGAAGPALTKFTYNAIDVVTCNVGAGGAKNGGGAGAAGGTTVTNFAGLTAESILFTGGTKGQAGNYAGSSVNIGGAGANLVPFGSGGAPTIGLTGGGGVNGNDAVGYGSAGGGGTADNTGRGGNGGGGMFEMEILG